MIASLGAFLLSGSFAAVINLLATAPFLKRDLQTLADSVALQEQWGSIRSRHS